jgi:adenylate cyclase
LILLRYSCLTDQEVTVILSRSRCGYETQEEGNALVSSVPPRDETSIADGKVAATDAQIELQRLLSSPDFSASARRKALLAYLVQQTVEGGAGKLKEFSIGLAVFGRDETFDPRADPVVRLETHRLRRDLDEFYRGIGRDDPIRIMIPKGGYSTTFEPQRNATEPRSPPTVGSAVAALISRPWLVVGSAVIALALLVTFQLELISRNPIAAARLGRDGSAAEARRGPIIALFAIRNTSPEPQDAYFTDGLSEQLVSDLLRFENLRVISPEGVKPYDDAINTVKNLRTQLGVDYVLRGNARRIDNKLRLALELADTKTDQVVWAETFMRELAPDDLVEVQKDISAKLAATIGSHYGAVVGPALPLAETQLPAQFSSYDCVLQYYALVKALSASRHLQVRSCLEETVKNEPGYATAWAVLANVYAQEYRFDFNRRSEQYDPLERSFDAARRAVLLEPQNPTAQLMLALSAFDRHDLDGFRRSGALAVDLNPNNPDVLGQYGLRLVYVGDWDRGETLIRKAMALNPSHPVWYREPLAFIRYQQANYEEALHEIDKYANSNPNFIWYQVFRAMTLGQLGRGEEAKSAVQGALRLRPDIRQAFWQMTRVWNIPEPQIEQMAVGLRKAGLEVISLEASKVSSSSPAP